MACLKVKVDRVENLAEEHSDKVAMMRLDESIGNLIKGALTYGSDLAIDISAWMAFKAL